MPSTDIQVLHRDRGTTFARIGNLLVVFAHGTPVQGTADTFAGLIKATRDPASGKVGVVVVIDTRALPDAEGRAEVLSFGKVLRETTAAAQVITGDGFAAAAQRSLLTAMTIGAGIRDRSRVLGELTDGIDWLGGLLDWDPASAGDASTAIRTFITSEKRLEPSATGA